MTSNPVTTIIDAFGAWVKDQGENILLAYEQGGKWDQWAEVCLATLCNTCFDNVTVSRERAPLVLKDNNGNNSTKVCSDLLLDVVGKKSIAFFCFVENKQDYLTLDSSGSESSGSGSSGSESSGSNSSGSSVSSGSTPPKLMDEIGDSVESMGKVDLKYCTPVTMAIFVSTVGNNSAKVKLVDDDGFELVPGYSDGNGIEINLYYKSV